MRESFYDYEGRDDSLPQKIYIEPTDMCNLNCSICFRHGWIDEELGMMDMSVFNTLAAQVNDMSSVQEVFFGGMGEPLFHPHICEMISGFIPSIKKSLLTNASLLTEDMSTGLIHAGLDELWISMDGFSKECYENIRQGGEYEKVIRHLEAFNEMRKTAGSSEAGTCSSIRNIRLCITFVITPQNVGQLRYIDEFADRYDIDEINISHMIPGKPMREEDMLQDRLDVPIGKMHRLKDGSEGVPEDECPFISKNCLFVRWDGEVSPCMQLLHSCRTYLYEEARVITRFAYGNLREQKLLDCWNNEEYEKFRGRVKEFYFPFCRHCSGCEDRKGNLRDCFLAEAPTCGACIWGSGKVFCP